MRIKLTRLLSISLLLCLGLVDCRRAQPHSVTLTWNASPNTLGVHVVGYNVYRSTNSGGPFVKLASRVPNPSYEDRLVANGRTYFYVVTALGQDGRESRFSDEVRAVIP
jgi:fibronectin type 3 domain-containing protein